jgi:chromosomal replication initiator protein
MSDMLFVDDVQFIGNKKETQYALFHVFNHLRNDNKQIILTSDRPPKEIIGLEERMTSRFEQGLLADISAPEYETRIKIVTRKAELMHLELPKNVVEFLADKLKKNIRQLEGAIIKINAMKTLYKTQPTIAMAQGVIRDILTEQKPVPETVEKIIFEVANAFNVTADDLRSKSRSADVSNARQAAIYIVHKITGISHSSIGKEFGNRDHSTIVYALSKVKEIMSTNHEYKLIIENIVKNFSVFQ